MHTYRHHIHSHFSRPFHHHHYLYFDLDSFQLLYIDFFPANTNIVRMLIHALSLETLLTSTKQAPTFKWISLN